MVSFDKIHADASEAWHKAGCRGTIEIITGHGKSKIFLNEAAKLPKTARVLFLAEATDREYDLELEKKKWNYDGPPILFMCYQSAYKLIGEHYDLVGADEIHDSLTPVYSAFYSNNTYARIMGLSATVDKKAKISEDSLITKGDLLKLIAPVVFTYSLKDGQENNTARKLKIYKISLDLDTVNKVVPAGTKLKPFDTTEFKAYEFYNKAFNQALFLPDSKAKTFQIQNASRKRADVLYNLPSKRHVTTKIMKFLQSFKLRFIIFGNSVDELNRITSNTVSSRNTDAKNQEIRSAFDNGTIDHLAAFKKLKQGANLSNLQVAVLHSYYGKEKDLIQRIGRLRNDGTLGAVIILTVRGTVEEKWFKSMWGETKVYDIIECDGVYDFFMKFNLKPDTLDGSSTAN